MNKNKSITTIMIIIFIVILAILMLAIVFLDYINIRNIFPFNQFTSQYDWFGIVGAIVGGLIGGLSTYIGIYFTIKNEQEENRKRDIDDRKRKGYSYLTFTDNPLTLKIAIDSVSTENLNSAQNILTEKNVKVVGVNYFDIELNFKNLNDNYPTAVILNNMEISYDSKVEDNRKIYKKVIFLSCKNKKYKPLTMMNDGIVAFSSRALISNGQMNNIKQYLLGSQFIDIIANISFINANGVVTTGRFSANLVKTNNTKIGNDNCLGSNKEKINYQAENTYLIIENVNYCEDYGEKIWGGK